MRTNQRLTRHPVAIAVIAALALTTLSACNGSSNSTPPITNPEPIPSPDVDLVSLTDNQIAVYYQRADGDYDGWGLHLWNGEGCGDYAAPTTESPNFNNWAEPYLADGVDDTYGAYYVLTIDPASADCFNFIMHKGDERGFGSANKRFDTTQDSQYAFGFHGNAQLFYEAISEIPVSLEGASAHWIDAETVVWEGGAAGDTVALAWSSDASMSFDSTNKSLANAQEISLVAASLTDEQKQKFPHLSGMTTFSLPTDTDATIRQQLIKSQLYAAAKNADGHVISVTKVQRAGALDALYTQANNDADEQQLGSWLTSSATQFALWAPTATAVNVHIYDTQKQEVTGSPFIMSQDAHGIYRGVLSPEFSEHFYRYSVTGYHPLTDKMETVTVTDPYSLSLATNSAYSQIIDLNAITTKPSGWDAQNRPSIANPEDHIIYEVQIRDFSAYDGGLSTMENRGKYAAFTEANSFGMKHLQRLQASGLNTIHLLPTFDIATINEADAEVVNVQDSVARLCEVNSEAAVCNDANVDQTQTIDALLATKDSNSGDAQEIVELLRSIDSYNWGYDPFHYTVPEGSYAKNADGASRIKEFRDMVLSLHNMGFRVVMDVVYNHTNASGLADKSVLDKIVPWYYHRLNTSTGEVETSTCCDNTATEHAMMSKLMKDSLVVWARDYAIDGFRFDLMGHQPKSAMLEARDQVWAIDPDNYFYGEGWNFGEVADDARFAQASQINMAGTSIGTFTDRLRDAIRGGGPFDGGNSLRANQGVANGLGTSANDLALQLPEADRTQEYQLSMDQARIGLAANLDDFLLLDAQDNTVRGQDVDYNGAPTGYAKDPADTINYVSKHDNQTLWDNLSYKADYALDKSQRIRMQHLSLAYPMLAQGIPFIHMGSELLRSKSFLRDSYDYGDWFNAVDFSYADPNTNSHLGRGNNADVGLPPAEKDGDNWDIVGQVLAGSAGNLRTNAQDIQSSATMFYDLLKLRNASPLFRLTSAADINSRIDFRNVGSSQQPGIIVMSIDDGQAVTDIDPNYDGLVVIFNNSTHVKQVALPTAGLQLHDVQMNGGDDAIKTLTVSGSTATMPALSVAVLVAPQGSEQGAGVPVDVSNKDTAAIPPWGATTVYLRGSMNGWDASTPAAFIYDGEYRLTVTLEAGDYEFKFASEDWSVINVGAANADISQSDIALGANGDNITLTITEAGTYQFSINASDLSQPVIRVSAQ